MFCFLLGGGGGGNKAVVVHCNSNIYIAFTDSRDCSVNVCVLILTDTSALLINYLYTGDCCQFGSAYTCVSTSDQRVTKCRVRSKQIKG